MKTITKFILATLAIWAAGGSVRAQGSGFTYNGRLTDGGSLASGEYELRFQLWDAAVQGSPVGPLVTNSPVTVSDGLFTTTINMGSTAFNGQACWLEIGVRPVGSPGGFVTLAPRQPVTPAPYAIHAQKAASLTGPLHDAQIPANVARWMGSRRSAER